MGLLALSVSLAGSARPLPEAGAQDDFTLNVDVELVTVPVSVLDREGRPVHDLAREHFRVFEDGVEQEIQSFFQEDVPISVGLIIDSSGSMSNKRERVSNAALVFVRESNPDDETFVITFNDEAFLEQDFTRSVGNLVDALDNIYNRGETAVNDAVFLGLDHVEFEGRMDKKALLVVSDGEDNASIYDKDEVMDRLRDAEVTVYAIGLLEDDGGGGLFGRSPAERARETLEEMAEATGGQAFFPESLDEIEEICRRIAHDLRNHYTINYTPSNTAWDGTLREIRVEVNPPRGFPRLEVRTKTSYRAPEGPRETSQ
jgi:VWFA-related protein